MRLIQQCLSSGFLAIGLFFASPASVLAAPGDLDTSFGNGGKIFTLFNFASARDIALQPDGKIVVTGVNNLIFTTQIVLVRYHQDGSLDTSFGDGGKVATSFEGPGRVSGIAIQSDGRIVVAGSGCLSGAICGFAVVRYQTDGSLDSSFDGDGKVIVDMGNEDFANALAIEPDGRIVVVGTSGPSTLNLAFATARLNPDGSLDTSFNGDGRVITSLGSFSDRGATSVALQPDGKIIVAGESGTGNHVSADFALVRYHPNGALDSTFGNDGKVITAVSGGYDFADEVAVQPDGKIVASGTSLNKDIAVVRYHPNGSLDETFDGDGIVRTSGYVAWSLALQQNGKIVVSGNHDDGETNPDFMLVRYNSNGSLDTSFGNGGIVTTKFDQVGYSISFAIAIQPDGKIVSAGFYGEDGEFSLIAVARYLGDSVVTNRKPTDFDGDGRADIAVFRPQNGSWWYLRSIDGGSRAFSFGVSTDKPVPGDFTGDNRADLAVFRPESGSWLIQRSEDNSFYSFPFGAAADITAPADFDGDGKTDAAVYRPSSGTWFILKSNGTGTLIVSFGNSTDQPVAADYDGDGRADIAVFRPSDGTWWYLQSSDGLARVYQFGISTDTPVQGDYTGDGKADIAVYRPSSGEWFIQRSEDNSYFAFKWGQTGDIPAPADYDGDGRLDAAVYRNGIWYQMQSTNGFSVMQFGLTGDKPVPTAFLP